VKTLIRRFGALLLFLAATLCFAPTLVPPFLDRIYYRGPPSGHFDGGHFFNPEDRAAPPRLAPPGFVGRWLAGSGRAAWPAHVAVPPGAPSVMTRLCAIRRPDSWEACKALETSGRMIVTWIGHSTVLIQVDGLNILTDPIWSERASPLGFAGPKRVRPPGLTLASLPTIDLILVSHNHYDHMDLPTLKILWDRDRPLIVTSLGNDMILKRAGIGAVAADWGGRIARIRPCANGVAPCRPAAIDVTVERVHHWGSRWGVDRNRALWSGFTIRLPGGNIFFAGDTGWGGGAWAAEAARHGPFRLAILPIGAYLPREVMASNHMDPEESVAAFERLNPGTALGVHWGTFQLTFEPIGDPPRRLAAALKARGIAPERFIASEVGQPFEVPPLSSGGASKVSAPARIR
jgi:L-ascorbate metabolism protein UlaG (beta-lactamase superfamily)